MIESNVRHLRRVTPPLAGYLRVGHRDGSLMAKLLEKGLPVGAGVILDPTAGDRTVDLRTSAVQNGVEAILDTRAVELSTIGGFASSTVARLPWAGTAVHVPGDLGGLTPAEMTGSIAAEAVESRVTGVLAPTHFLDIDRNWLYVDVELTERLRADLDRSGAGGTVIYYPLVASLKVLRDPVYFAKVKSELRGLISRRQVDGIFVRVQGFGTNKAGPLNLRKYLALCRDLHDLGVPVVGERTGTVGVALAAFGAIGGVESSVTFGETYDARRLLKPPKGGGFVPPPRVYLDGALVTVDKEDARALMAKRGLSRLGCRGACCQQGRQSMIEDPRRHFVVTRAGELSRLSIVPDADRAEHYVSTVLAPARDNAAQLARSMPALASHRDRLDDWYLSLKRILAEDAAVAHSTALAPTGRRLARGA